MATRNTYYFDTASFANATTIFLDADLSSIAPNGFYSDNVEVRQQTSGVLLAAQSCVTPTPVPSPVAPVPVPVPAAPVPVPIPTPTAPVAPPPVVAPVISPVVVPVNIPAAPVAIPVSPPVFVPVTPPLTPPVKPPVKAPVSKEFYYRGTDCSTRDRTIARATSSYSIGTVVQYTEFGVTSCMTLDVLLSNGGSNPATINYAVSDCDNFVCFQ